MAGSLVPDVGNVSINTTGALNNLMKAYDNFGTALALPGDRMTKLADKQELRDRLEKEDALKAEALAYSRSRDALTDKRYDETLAKAEAEKNFLRLKEANTADALNALENKDMFIANKIAGEKKAAYDSLNNLEGQEKIDTKNQLDTYFSGQGAIESGKNWLNNALTNTNVDAGTLYNARLNKEKLANDRADRAEDLKWKEKEYNLNLMKIRMSGEPKYKGQVYTDPKTGSFVTTRSANEEQVLAQNGWTFGKNPNAGKTDSTTGAKKDADKDYSAGYKKLEEKVFDYGSFDDSTALENLEMLKMLKINPNDVDSMITQIEANTAFDKTLNYNDMNKYGPQIKSSDGKLLPLGDGIELIKKEGYITVFENGKPVLYKPTETKAIEEKLKEVEKTSKAPDYSVKSDIDKLRSEIAVKKQEKIDSFTPYVGGVGVPYDKDKAIEQQKILLAKKEGEDKIKKEYESLNSKFKNDVSLDDYISNPRYKQLYDLDYKNK